MTYEEFWQPLCKQYDAGEAKAIARMVLDVQFGLSLADIVCGKTEAIAHHELQDLQQRLLTGEPVQYVLGQAEFCGRTFSVGPSVLIPRPETEELCRWVLESQWGAPCSLLDIGTGSGCIAVTLAAALPQAAVTAWDLSEDALQVARENARQNHVSVTFRQVDALRLVPPREPQWDVIVSNPPYICEREADDMERNVLDFEPSEALFVPDDDPLLFYRSIGNYAQSALPPGGQLFFEINPLYEDFVAEHLLGLGFDVDERDDQFGKTRFIRGIR